MNAAAAWIVRVMTAIGVDGLALIALVLWVGWNLVYP